MEIIKKMLNRFIKFIKYSIIGFCGLGVEIITIWLTKDILHINEYISNSAGMLLGMINNFILNAFFNFKQKDKLLKRFIPYSIIWLFMLGISNLTLNIIWDNLGFNFWIAKTISIGIVTLLGYFLHSRITFR